MRLAVPFAVAGFLVLTVSATPAPAGILLPVDDFTPCTLDIWGSADHPGSGPDEFDHPFGIAVDAQDFIYVADQQNNRVVKLTPAGEMVLVWGEFGRGPGQMYHPTGITCAPNGEVLVVEHQNHRVSRFTADGRFIDWIGASTDGNRPGQFYYPVAVATDASGFVYVTDSDNDRVQKFTSTGQYVSSWSTSMSGPYGIVVGPDGFVYVSQNRNHRVLKFTSDGALVASWGGFGEGRGQFFSPEGSVFDAHGHLYVCDTGNNRIQKFTADGTFIESFGRQGQGAGDLYTPSDIAIDSKGSIYIAEWNNARIQKFGFNMAGRAPDVSRAHAVLERDWPADHQLVGVSIRGVANSNCGAMTIAVTGITQDEPVKGHSTGGTCPDAVIGPDGQASVRLERIAAIKRLANGRVYRIAFDASDDQGNVAHGVALACVPVSGSGGSCVDDGAVYNSLATCEGAVAGGQGPDPAADQDGDPSGDPADLRAAHAIGSRVLVEFALPAEGEVTLAMYDVAGRRVQTLDRGSRASGVHSVSLAIESLPRGVYFVRLVSDRGTRTRTIVLR